MPLTRANATGAQRSPRAARRRRLRSSRSPTARPERGGLAAGALELVADPAASRRAARRRRAAGAPSSVEHGVRADRACGSWRRGALHERALGREAGERVAIGQCSGRRGHVARRRRAPPARGSPGPGAGTIASASIGVPSPARPSRSRPGLREHDRVEVALREPPQPRVDVAAQLAHVEVRSQREQRGAAAQARRAHHRALGQVRRATPRRRARRVRRRARARPRSRGRSGSSDGTSLAECTARSISPGEQRLLDLLDEARLVRANPRAGSTPLSGWRSSPTS